MADIEATRAAQKILGKKLNRPDWLRGIGIIGGPELGYGLVVNVGKLTEEVAAAIPLHVEGVSVSVVEVGTIVALEAQ